MHMIPPAGVRAAGRGGRLALTAALAAAAAGLLAACGSASAPTTAASVPASSAASSHATQLGRGRVRVGCPGRGARDAGPGQPARPPRCG